MNPSPDRRRFLLSAASMIPALHAAPLLAIMTRNDPSKPSGPEARFARLSMRTAINLEAMAAFYRDTLRLPVEFKGRSLLVTAGETIIEFTKVEKATGASAPYYHFAFNVPHNQLDAAKAWLEPRCPLVQRNDGGGVIFHFEHWNAHAFYFLDPAGSILEFIARHTLKNDRAGEFTEKNILCASEIGVVAPDVVKAADQLSAVTKLDRYHGGGEAFTAVGDEQGLFIVVKTGRKWFSSDRAAEVFEAEAMVRTDTMIAPVTLPDSRFSASPASDATSR